MVVYDVGCDLPFLLGPDDKMPMRSHRTPSQDAERMERVGRDHDPLERLEIDLFAEQRQPRCRPNGDSSTGSL